MVKKRRKKRSVEFTNILIAVISLWGVAIMYHLTHQLPSGLFLKTDFYDEFLEEDLNLVDDDEEPVDDDEEPVNNKSIESQPEPIKMHSSNEKSSKIPVSQIIPEPKEALSAADLALTGNRNADKLNRMSGSHVTHRIGPNEGLPTTGIEQCPFQLYGNPNKHDFSDIEPYLKTIRRDHYLINLSPFGPNNQLRGFRDTLLLAIYLNRTIVMPPFFKHRTDPSSTRAGYLYQDPQQKLDGVEMAKLMPTITIEQFADRCPGGLDVAFLARRNSNSSEVGRLTM